MLFWILITPMVLYILIGLWLILSSKKMPYSGRKEDDSNGADFYG